VSISYAADFESRLEAVNDMLMAVADRNCKPLKMFLKLNEPVDNLKYEWVDKTLVGFKDTVYTALASSSTTVLTVAGGTNTPKRYIDGVSLIRVESEVMLVTSTVTVVTNSRVLNVTRAQVGTTASTHPAGAQVLIIGNPKNEGFSAGRDDSQKGVRAYNYTQILYREAKLSGTSQSVRAVGSEMKLDKQVADLLPEIMKELQYTFFHGIRYAADQVDFTDRRMGGMYYYATQGGGTNEDQGGDPLVFEMLDDVIQQYIQNGGDATKLCMFVPVTQQRKLNDLKEARIISGGVSQSDNTMTNFWNRYEFGSSAQVDVIMTPDLADDEVYFCQKDLVGVHPMKERQFKRKPLPEDGDYVREMILGEYTGVFRNVRETLFRLHGLSV
jgi:hypothetical protein